MLKWLKYPKFISAGYLIKYLCQIFIYKRFQQFERLNTSELHKKFIENDNCISHEQGLKSENTRGLQRAPLINLAQKKIPLRTDIKGTILSAQVSVVQLSGFRVQNGTPYYLFLLNANFEIDVAVGGLSRFVGLLFNITFS